MDVDEYHENRKTIFPGCQKSALNPASAAEGATNTHDEPSRESQQKITGFRFSKPPVQLRKTDRSPWSDYAKIMEKDQSGPAILANTRNRFQKIVVIKEVRGCKKDWLCRLDTITHENIVHFCAAYYHGGSIFLIYEVMSVSLLEILTTPKGHLLPYEIATICLSILHGINYLHEYLKMAHGNIRTDIVLLAKDGTIKIGKPITCYNRSRADRE